MKLTVTFETWLLGDGVYPPLERGQLVNIALQLQPELLGHAPPEAEVGWSSTETAEYHLVAQVLSVPAAGRDLNTIAVDAGGLRVYVEECKLPNIKVGDRIEARGSIGFDYYWWSERMSAEHDIPDIFHSFKVERLRRVPIPDRFVHRNEQTVASPTRVGPAEWEADRIEEVARMSHDSELFSFYLVDLDDEPVAGRHVARTFIS